MNKSLKTALLTLLTLSVFSIAIIEMSGISRTALFNKFSSEDLIRDREGRADLKAHNDTIDAIATEMPKTQISFTDRNHDFGKVKEGETVNHIYTFTNTGDYPLIISDAIPSCGCTVPNYSKEPIGPGEQGTLEVAFNSKNQKGKVHKNIIVVSNALDGRTSISFEAEVYN